MLTDATSLAVPTEALAEHMRFFSRLSVRDRDAGDTLNQASKRIWARAAEDSCDGRHRREGIRSRPDGVGHHSSKAIR